MCPVTHSEAASMFDRCRVSSRVGGGQWGFRPPTQILWGDIPHYFFVLIHKLNPN